MHISKTAVFIMLLIIMVTVASYASYFGFSVHGANFGMGIVEGASPSGITAFLGFLWGFIVFWFAMMVFAIDGIPAIFSLLWNVLAIINLFILLTSFQINILGTGGGGSGSD